MNVCAYRAYTTNEITVKMKSLLKEVRKKIHITCLSMHSIHEDGTFVRSEPISYGICWRASHTKHDIHIPIASERARKKPANGPHKKKTFSLSSGLALIHMHRIGNAMPIALLCTALDGFLLKSNWIFSSCKHFNLLMRAMWVWPPLWMVFLLIVVSFCWFFSASLLIIFYLQ